MELPVRAQQTTTGPPIHSTQAVPSVTRRKTAKEKKIAAHLAVHRKVDRRVDLLDALAARHASPVRRRERTRGHELRREAERLESLQEANNKEARLVKREFLSETLRTVIGSKHHSSW